MSFRRALLVATFAAALTAFAADAPPSADASAPASVGAYDRVIIEPTKTSIYIGSVSLTMPPLVRTDARYEAPYVAKVFPYFFYNENGTLTVDVTAEMLRALERGEPIEFKGRAVNTDGEERRVEGKATPTSARGGKVKVRVFVSRRVELIFNTTYRFPENTNGTKTIL